MDLFLAICTAIGLGLATGIGGPLAALFIAVMASFQAGIDLRGTDWDFIGAGWFIATLFVLNVAAYFECAKEFDLRVPVVGIAAVLGGVFGAGALAAEADSEVLGFLVGAAAATGAAVVAFGVLQGARRRAADSDAPGTAETLGLIFGFAGIVTALLALYLPPASLLAAIGLAVLASGRRRKAGEKFEGLRVLR